MTTNQKFLIKVLSVGIVLFGIWMIAVYIFAQGVSDTCFASDPNNIIIIDADAELKFGNTDDVELKFGNNIEEDPIKEGKQ